MEGEHVLECLETDREREVDRNLGAYLRIYSGSWGVSGIGDIILRLRLNGNGCNMDD